MNMCMLREREREREDDQLGDIDLVYLLWGQVKL